MLKDFHIWHLPITREISEVDPTGLVQSPDERHVQDVPGADGFDDVGQNDAMTLVLGHIVDKDGAGGGVTDVHPGAQGQAGVVDQEVLEATAGAHQ